MKLICIMLGIVALSFTGCGQPVKGNGLDSVQSIHAICQVKAGATVVVCVDYADDTQANRDNCAEQATTYSTHGANATQWVGVGTATTTGCSMENGGLSLVGSCLMLGSDIRYYNTMWGLQAAQTDCTSHSGNWQ